MSAWLVDTHALLWFLADDSNLSAAAKTTMESGAEVLLVSTASLWEIAIKSALGKVVVPDDLPGIVRAEGFQSLAVTPAHVWAVRDLPVGPHKDPFDRLLVAQARTEGLSIISSDERFDQYPVTRHW
ncbi:type II toxin-antitoxin system VapC family toxin [Paraconexibacter algicola]|uniref:PIN domain nuclease n=1 Tax=Paraconexibacter algicola TaxID=2133960 RepID=A0A2T4UCN4_9ACTN|nr:type II toxin-antitoxin system VapC family toxin [Paraconexibacter algicola]PTL54976.1 PIN domain nuclease [Paraconexibacter algicola]